MEAKRRSRSHEGNLSRKDPITQTRLKSPFPITIKGFNALGERYDETALIEDIGRRGLCCRTSQTLVPGSVFTVYKSEDLPDSVAVFEVVWAKPLDGKIKKVGAELVGNNRSWMRYLIEEIQFPPDAVATRRKNPIKH